MRIQPLRSSKQNFFSPTILALFVCAFSIQQIQNHRWSQTFPKFAALTVGVDNSEIGPVSRHYDKAKLREVLSRLPVLLKENSLPSSGELLRKSLSPRTSSESTEVTEHASQYTVRSAFKYPLECNPSFTLPRLMQKKVHTHFQENHAALYNDSSYEWDWHRWDVSIFSNLICGPGTFVSGGWGSRYTTIQNDFGCQGPVHWRNCITQGLSPVDAKSQIHSVMTAHNLLTKNVHSGSTSHRHLAEYEAANADPISSGQDVAFFWNYNINAEIEIQKNGTHDQSWDDERWEEVLRCFPVERNFFSALFAGTPATDAECSINGKHVKDPEMCTCTHAFNVEEFVWRFDKLINVSRLRSQSLSWYDMSIAYVIISAYLVGTSLYSPASILMGWLVNEWVLRLLSLRVLYITVLRTFMPIYDEAKDYCFGAVLAKPTIFPFSWMPGRWRSHHRTQPPQDDRYDTDLNKWGNLGSSIPGSQVQPYLPGFYCKWEHSVSMDVWGWYFWVFGVFPLILSFRTKKLKNNKVKNHHFDRSRDMYPSNWRGLHPAAYFVKLLAVMGVCSILAFVVIIFYWLINNNSPTLTDWDVNTGFWCIDLVLMRADPLTLLLVFGKASMELLAFTMATIHKGYLTNKLEDINNSTRGGLLHAVAMCIPPVIYAWDYVISGCTYELDLGHYSQHRNWATGAPEGPQRPEVMNICEDRFRLSAQAVLSIVFVTPTVMFMSPMLKTIQLACAKTQNLSYSLLRFTSTMVVMLCLFSWLYWFGSCEINRSLDPGMMSRVKYAWPLCTEDQSPITDGCREASQTGVWQERARTGTHGNLFKSPVNNTGDISAPYEMGSCRRGMQNRGFAYLWTHEDSYGKRAAKIMIEYYNKKAAEGRELVSRREIYEVDSEQRYNMTYVLDTKYDYPAPQFGNTFVYIFYALIQSITLSSFGDAPPSSAFEKVLYAVITLLGLGVMQTSLVNTLCIYLTSMFTERCDFVRNSLGCMFSQTTSQNSHRLSHTRAILWHHWDLWAGIQPLNPASTDLDIMPASIRTETKFMVLESLLKDRHSTLLSKLNPSALRNLADSLEYHILHKHDIIISCCHVQEFVLIVTDGQIVTVPGKRTLNAVDTKRLQIHQVHLEIECYFGERPQACYRCISEYAEYYMIPRKALVKAIESCSKATEYVNSLVKSEGRRQNHHVASEGAVLAARSSEGLHGLTAPILSQLTYTLPKLSDIFVYAEETKMHDVEGFDVSAEGKAKDGCNITGTSDWVKMSLKEYIQPAYNRTSQRLGVTQHHHTDNSWFAVNMKRLRNKEHRQGGHIPKKSMMVQRATHHAHIINALSNVSGTESSLSNRGSAIGMSIEAMKHHHDQQLLNVHSTQSLGMDMDESDTSLVNETAVEASQLSLASIQVSKIMTKQTKKARRGQRHTFDSWFLWWNFFNSFFCVITIFEICMGWGFVNPRSSKYSYTYLITKWLILDTAPLYNVFLFLNTEFLDDRKVLVWNQSEKFRRLSKTRQFTLACGILPLDLIAGMYTGNVDIYHRLRLIRLIYNFFEPRNYWNGKERELSGSTESVGWLFLVPCVITIQLFACIAYLNSCYLSVDKKVREDLFMASQASCYPGSWGWITFGEYSEQPLLDPVWRAITTMYWKLRLFTAYNHSNIIPSYTPSVVLVTVETFLSFLFITIMSTSWAMNLSIDSESLLVSDFKSHMFMISQVMKDSKLREIIIRTKEHVFHRYHGLAVPGLHDAEDNLFPIDRVLVKHDQIEAAMRFIPIFRDLPKTLQMKLSMAAHTYQYAAGQVVVRAGEKLQCMYFIRSGVVELSNRKDEKLGFLEPGQTFNFLEMVAETPSRITVTCETMCELIHWNFDQMQAIFATCQVWNPFDEKYELTDKCASAVKVLKLKPVEPDHEFINETKKVSCDETLSAMKLAPDTRENAEDASKEGFNYQCWNSVRIVAHIAVNSFVLGYFFDSFLWKALLLLLDCAAIYNMSVNANLVRRNPETRRRVRVSIWCKEYYSQTSFVFEFITVILPILVDIINGWDHLLSLMLRVFQYRQVLSFFDFVEKSLDRRVFWNDLHALCNLFLWVFLGTGISMRVARWDGEADDRLAVGLPFNGKVKVNKNGWINQAYSMIESNDAFTGVNPKSRLDSFIIGFGYHADAATGAGSGQMIPSTHCVYEFIWDFVFQMVGLYCCVMVSANFVNHGEIQDKTRQHAETIYFHLANFFNCAGENIPQATRENAMEALRITYRRQAGSYRKILAHGLPKCAVKDLIEERYGEILRQNMFAGKNGFLRVRNVAQYIKIIATGSNTWVLHKKQLCEHAFVVVSGEYVTRSADDERRVLKVGAFYAPGRISTHKFICKYEGELLCIPYAQLSKVKYNKSMLAITDAPQIKMPGSEEPAPDAPETTASAIPDEETRKDHYEFSRGFCVVGVLLFVYASWTYFYYDSYPDPDNNNMIGGDYKCGAFKENPTCASWNPGAYTDVDEFSAFFQQNMFACIMFVADLSFSFLVWWQIISVKRGLEDVSLFSRDTYNSEEQLAMMATLPLPFQLRWIARAIWFVVEHIYTYDRELVDISTHLYHVRIIKFGLLWAFCGVVHMVGCIGIWYMCPGGVCTGKSMARMFTYLMEQNEEGEYVHAVQQNPYHRMSISDASTFVDTFYATLDAFVSSGQGSIMPHNPFMIVLRGLLCLLGEIVLATVLGFARNMTDCAEEQVRTAYINARNRIKLVLKKTGVPANKSRYILGYVDANFTRSLHFDISDAFKDMHVAPAVRRDLFYHFYGPCIAHTAVFQGLSEDVIMEITMHACRLENYFAGHVVQDFGTVIDGAMCLKSGAVTVGRRYVKIEGESIYQQYMDDSTATSPSRIIAFTKCEVVRLDYGKILKVLKHYPHDLGVFQQNLRQLKERYGLNVDE